MVHILCYFFEKLFFKDFFNLFGSMLVWDMVRAWPYLISAHLILIFALETIQIGIKSRAIRAKNQLKIRKMLHKLFWIFLLCYGSNIKKKSYAPKSVRNDNRLALNGQNWGLIFSNFQNFSSFSSVSSPFWLYIWNCIVLKYSCGHF